MYYSLRAFAGATCLLMALPAQSQTDSTAVQQLGEVVVSDSRIPLRWQQSGKTVIRLDRRDLENFRGLSMAEIINVQTGFEISGSRGRPGEVLGVFARGGRGRQVLVLIDGVRVTDPSSASQEYDLRFLQASDVESVEILKGAASTLYGTNAATAVIDIRTRRPSREPLTLNVGSELGTHRATDDPEWELGQYRQFARLGGSSGPFGYQAGISHQRATGLSSLQAGEETDPFSNLSLSSRLDFAPAKGSRLELTANRTTVRTEYDDSFAGADAPFLYLSDQTRLGLSFRQEMSRATLEARVGYSSFDSENRSNFPNEFRGSSWVGDLVYKHRIGDHVSVLGGLMAAEDRARLDGQRSFTFIDPYLNVVLATGDGVNLNAGARLNLHSEYGSQWVYQVNPSYALVRGKDTFKALATWATAYITPTLSQLFGAFGANPELEPENDRTLEAGLAWQREAEFRMSILYFDRREIQAVIYDGVGMQYRNSPDEINVSGLEAEITWFPRPDWKVTAGYTYTDREGDAAIRIPSHKARLRLDAQLSPRWNGSLYYRYTGKRTDTDFSTFTDIELPAFSLVGARLGFRVCPGKLDAYLRADNLLNESFTEVIGFQTPGRTFLLGWNLRL